MSRAAAFWMQDLRCFPHEEGLNLADVVESKSAGSGHRGDVGCAAQLVIQYDSQLVKDPPQHPQQLPVGPCEVSPSPARRGAQSC